MFESDAILRNRGGVRMAAAQLVKKKKKKIFNSEDLPLYLMALPTLIFLVIFAISPWADW